MDTVPDGGPNLAQRPTAPQAARPLPCPAAGGYQREGGRHAEARTRYAAVSSTGRNARRIGPPYRSVGPRRPAARAADGRDAPPARRNPARPARGRTGAHSPAGALRRLRGAILRHGRYSDDAGARLRLDRVVSGAIHRAQLHGRAVAGPRPGRGVGCRPAQPVQRNPHSVVGHRGEGAWGLSPVRAVSVRQRRHDVRLVSVRGDGRAGSGGRAGGTLLHPAPRRLRDSRHLGCDRSARFGQPRRAGGRRVRPDAPHVAATSSARRGPQSGPQGQSRAAVPVAELHDLRRVDLRRIGRHCRRDGARLRRAGQRPRDVDDGPRPARAGAATHQDFRSGVGRRGGQGVVVPSV